jgi:hypothetical protein
MGRPPAIGIVDGYFQVVPAVWHKEILWAMAQGIHVFGSASMGALRAAELLEFGMEGVGWIFEQFACGAFEDDDEVAVTHQNEHGMPPYGALSEAMVNIRRTLETAVSAAVISSPTGARLVGLAKSRFYPERAYPGILRLGYEAGLPSAELDGLAEWLPTGRIDQKRRDALAMLRTIRERLDAGMTPKTVDYHFEQTQLFEELSRQATELAVAASVPGQPVAELLDELRLEGRLPRLRLQALGRALVIREARGHLPPLDDEAVSETVRRFRRDHNMTGQGDIERWADENELTDDQLIGLLHDEAVVRWACETVGGDADRYLLDVLRISGSYSRLRGRASAKRQASEADPGAEDPIALMSRSDELLEWFSARRNGVARGLEDLAEQLGFDDGIDLLRALHRERLYLSATGGDQMPSANEGRSWTAEVKED